MIIWIHSNASICLNFIVIPHLLRNPKRRLLLIFNSYSIELGSGKWIPAFAGMTGGGLIFFAIPHLLRNPKLKALRDQTFNYIVQPPQIMLEVFILLIFNVFVEN